MWVSGLLLSLVNAFATPNATSQGAQGTTMGRGGHLLMRRLVKGTPSASSLLQNHVSLILAKSCVNEGFASTAYTSKLTLIQK